MKALVITIVLTLSLLATAPAAARTVYSVTYDDGSVLVGLAEEGIAIRHVGDGEALIEGDADLGARLRGRGRIVEEVAEVARWDELYLSYPSGDVEDLRSHGDVLWSEPDGAALVGASSRDLPGLRRASFMIYRLPAAIDVASWFDNTPPPPVRIAMARDERRVRGLVDGAIEAVSQDSLVAHVRRLSQDAGGEFRSRYFLREEKVTEARSYIVDALEHYLPAPAVIDTQDFMLWGQVCGDTSGVMVEYPMGNIIGTLPGNGRLQGYYIVGAHYDATATNSFSDMMWWCENPAPGADDNATGVAVVLETARILSEIEQLEFPFDVRFVLFDAEEPGLYGSTFYAQSAAAQGDTIYGMINVDMIAYNLAGAAADTSHIVTNRGTRWLADWLANTTTMEAYDEHFEGFEVSRIDKALAYSDHAPFWIEGYDALIAIEHWNPRDRNPYYHTVGDTFGNIWPSQLHGVGKMVAGAIARLADPDFAINLAVFPDDFRFTPNEFWTNTATTVRVDVHVFGPEEYVDLTLEVWDGPEDEGELLSVFQTERTMGAGEVITHEFGWIFEEDDLGYHEVTARIIAEGVDELTEEDNIATVSIRVNAPALFVTDHYPYPNPFPSPSGEPAELSFGYDLSRDAGSVQIDVLDITGQTLGSFSKYHDPVGSTEENMGTLAGWNTISWTEFTGSATHLASGVYIYQLRVYDRGEEDPSGLEAGKFAVVR